MDEARISTVPRTAGWLKFEYYNMASGILSIGSQTTSNIMEQFDSGKTGRVSSAIVGVNKFGQYSSLDPSGFLPNAFVAEKYRNRFGRNQYYPS